MSDAVTLTIILFVVFVGIPVVCWLAVRAARDMDARGRPGWGYGMLVLCLPPIGLVVWLAARARRPLAAP